LETLQDQAPHEESALECNIAPPVLAYINGEMENPSSSDSADEEEEESKEESDSEYK
jgi:hypothetical protein